MPQLPRLPSRPPLVRRLLKASGALFALFWVAVIAGKLRISAGFNSLPLAPEVGLLFLLVAVIILALSACLIEESRHRDGGSRGNHITKGDQS